MKKKWIVLGSLCAVTIVGLIFTVPMWRPLWDSVRLGPKPVVDSTMRMETIDQLVAKLHGHYVFPDKAKQIEAVLRQRQRAGNYEGITDGDQLAQRLTADMRAVAADLHMTVGFSPGPVPHDDAAGPPPETQAEWERRTNVVMRLIMQRLASGRVEKVEQLSPNIGYLKISGFPPPFLVADKFAMAMNQLADTDALIVDLRDNRGGAPQSVALLISYFVDRPTRLNDIWSRDTGVTTQQWTHDTLDGKRYGGKKPVFILAGPGTMSAGEDFAYTMQALKRATVIGERTWGGAHPARPYRLGEHFFAVIPGRRTISPVTGTNWEGVGVTPDIAATPDSALAVARERLQRRPNGTAPLAAAGH